MGKTELIERALNDDVIELDDSFVLTCRERMKNEKQHDAVLEDINSFRNSTRGIMFAQCQNMMSNISKWNNWRFITLTFRPNWRQWRNPIAKNAAENSANEARCYVMRFNEELTKTILGNKAVRKGQRIRQYAKPGGDADLIALHYHVIVEVPPGIDVGQFDQAVTKSWTHGTTDARRYNDDIKSVCLYLLENEKQIRHKIDAELFNADILNTFKH
jgi:hypothetical protein